MAIDTLGMRYSDADWPHGLRCVSCHHAFREGEPYTTRLVSFVGDSPLAEVVCLDCFTSGCPTQSRP